jgi:hypothetical protein
MGAELLEATRAVVEHRSGVLRHAAHNPLSADYAELWLMGAEKLSAFSAAGAVAASDWAKLSHAWLNGSGVNAERLARNWSRTMRPIHSTATANARRLKSKRRS